MTDAIALYREMHGNDMHHPMLLAIEELVCDLARANRLVALHEEDLARIAGADYRDDGSAASCLSAMALRINPLRVAREMPPSGDGGHG